MRHPMTPRRCGHGSARPTQRTCNQAPSTEYLVVAATLDVSPEYLTLASHLEWRELAAVCVASRVSYKFEIDKAAQS